VTDLQPLRHESDSFFDFDCELESPGSPVDECEYLRLIETASNTPHNSTAESGYACASMASSHSSSTDGPYFDASASASTSTAAAAQDQKLPASELKEYVNTIQQNGRHGLVNGVQEKEQPAVGEPAPEDEAFLQAQILSEIQQHSISLRAVEQTKPEEEPLRNGHLEEAEEMELKEVLEVAGTTDRAPEVVSTERAHKEVSQEEEVSTDRAQEESRHERVQTERVQDEIPYERVQEEIPTTESKRKPPTRGFNRKPPQNPPLKEPPQRRPPPPTGPFRKPETWNSRQTVAWMKQTNRPAISP